LLLNMYTNHVTRVSWNGICFVNQLHVFVHFLHSSVLHFRSELTIYLFDKPFHHSP